MADEIDFLDTLLKPAAEPEDDDDKPFRGPVVWERAADSAEIEQRERDYLEAMKHPELLDRNPRWPAVFIDSDGRVMLSKAERDELESFFGVTADEYRELYEEKP